MAERPTEDKAVESDEVMKRGLGTDLAVHVAQGVAGGATTALLTHLLHQPSEPTVEAPSVETPTVEAPEPVEAAAPAPAEAPPAPASEES